MSEASMKPFSGRTALITGSGQNIGKAIALAFARLGANVVVNGHRNKAAIDAVAAEARSLGVGALGVLADVADAAAVQSMVDQATATFGGVDMAACVYLASETAGFVTGQVLHVNGGDMM